MLMMPKFFEPIVPLIDLDNSSSSDSEEEPQEKKDYEASLLRMRRLRFPSANSDMQIRRDNKGRHYLHLP